MCDVLDGKRCGVLDGKGQVMPRAVAAGQSPVDYGICIEISHFPIQKVDLWMSADKVLDLCIGSVYCMGGVGTWGNSLAHHVGAKIW